MPAISPIDISIFLPRQDEINPSASPHPSLPWYRQYYAIPIFGGIALMGLVILRLLYDVWEKVTRTALGFQAGVTGLQPTDVENMNRLRSQIVWTERKMKVKRVVQWVLRRNREEEETDVEMN